MKWNKKRAGILLAAVCLLVLACSFASSAAYPAFSQSKPLIGYGWAKKAYPVYSDSSLQQKADTLSYRVCKVSGISGNAAKVVYEKGGEVFTGWIPLKTFVYNPDYKHQISFANAPFTIYKRPAVGAPYTKVMLYSGGIAVSEKGSWVEVIFNTGGKYRLGWMKKSSFTSQVRLSMDTTTQNLANGTYTISPRNSSALAMTYQKDTNSFALTKNKKSSAQKFMLTHYRNNYYFISPELAEGNLCDKSLPATAEGNQHMWLLKRTGGYFYIRAKGSGRCLTYASGNVKAGAWKKLKVQQWKITKVPQTPTKESSTVFSQYDPKWGGSTYMNGPSRRTISTSGCGVMALTNAVYAMNGEFISPTKIAKFSVSRGHYFYNQGTADTLYKDFAKKYGATYHFKHKGKVYSLNSVRKHLQSGGTAIALVPGHYIAIVAYRPSDQSYLVLDSAVYGKRPTTIEGDWVSASTLRSGYMYCEYFHLLSRR